MIFSYILNIGIRFAKTEIDWGESRNLIRAKISERFKEDNSIIDISNYHKGSHDFNIYTRRDIYESFNEVACYIFLNYDKTDLLRDIEIHSGVSVEVEEILLSFNKRIEIIIEELNNISDNFKIIDEGCFFSKKMKLVISSSESIGGDSKNLGYIFMSKDVSHLGI
jgi:predicted metallo-beta-lactamase superfamily hydrolase